MKTLQTILILLASALTAISSFAQDEAASPGTSPAVTTSPVAAPSGQPNEAEMMKQMMEMSKLNENHKLLADLAGTWSYTVKFWMNPDPNAKPQESKGTAVRKSMMDGRFFVTDSSGKMQMPGEDGKMKDLQYKGMDVEGYDNVKKKFFSSSIDNMGTGIYFFEGAYDPTTKIFAYTGEMETVPGMKAQVRELLKMTDKDHILLEWYENRGGQEKKTMEIAYTRAGKK